MPKSNHEITEIGGEMHDVICHAEGDTKGVGRLESKDKQRLQDACFGTTRLKLTIVG